MHREAVTYSNKIVPMEGKIFGKYKVLSFSHITENKSKAAYWNCICECGNERKICGTSLRRGHTTQCQSCNMKIVGRRGLDSMAKKHLYIAKCGLYFKIGSSDNPKRRMKDLQSSCPYPVEEVAILYDRGNEEANWHAHYKEQHHHGEWFFGICEIL